MPGGESPHAGYSYAYHVEGGGAGDSASEAQQAEDMRYIQETILTLTGGCEVCQHSVGPFCKKHKHPIEPGDPRCEDFARRLPEDPDSASRAQARRFVKDTLGIRDERSVDRLIGTS